MTNWLLCFHLGFGTKWVAVPNGPDNHAAQSTAAQVGAHRPAQPPCAGLFRMAAGPSFSGNREHLELKVSTRKFPHRFWAQVTVGGITGLLYVVTPFWPDWIEAISGWDPDQHKGSFDGLR